MAPHRRPDQHLLVLAGGGHSHALLLRRWILQPRLKPARTAVLLINRRSTALYSGLVPALVAGLLPEADGAIDLRELCRCAGVAFLQAEIIGLDAAAGTLVLEGRPPLLSGALFLVGGLPLCLWASSALVALAWLSTQRLKTA